MEVAQTKAGSPAGVERGVCISSGEEALRLARDLLPEIEAADAAYDTDRRVADEIVHKIGATGLFGIVMPKSLGGSELGFADLVRVTAEFGTASGSAAWVYGVLAGHSWLINLFPERAQREVMRDAVTLIATVFRLGGKVVEAEGGYQLTSGSGRFCSGIDYADWVIIGNAVKKADGSTEPRFFVVPKADIEVVDDWHTIGMRGTGSRSIRIDQTFIPAHRSCSLADMLAGSTPGAQTHSGAIYRMPFTSVAPFSIIGAPLGMARGMARNFAAHIGSRLADAEPLTVAQQSATLARIGETSAEIDAALALVLADAELIDRAQDPADITPLHSARIARDWAWAAQKARHAANRIFEASGGSSIYDGQRMQQMFRDVNSSTQHFAFTWDSAMTGYGRIASGLKANDFALPKGG